MSKPKIHTPEQLEDLREMVEVLIKEEINTIKRLQTDKVPITDIDLIDAIKRTKEAMTLFRDAAQKLTAYLHAVESNQNTYTRHGTHFAKL